MEMMSEGHEQTIANGATSAKHLHDNKSHIISISASDVNYTECSVRAKSAA
jgi:hypothetical protein